MQGNRAYVLTVCGLIAATALAGCSGGNSNSPGTATSSASSSGTPSPTSTASPGAAGTGGAGLQQDYVRVVHQVLPSTVEILTNKALGSGIVFDDKGDIVTNDHVVGNAKQFKVHLAGSGASFDATLVGAYAPDDLAVIRLKQVPDHLNVASFGDSSKLKIGDIVLAMGNPLGLSGTVTDGIVSATGRTVNEPQGGDSPGATLPDAIQTSAAINPGNSGGALVDLSGKVVGIPTLAAVDQQIGGGSAAPGIGFAIPSNIVTNIAGQLVKDGKVTHSHRAEIGVFASTVTNASGQPEGAGIARLDPGGPAENAGLKPGQIIVTVGGRKVDSAAQLADVLTNFTPGRTVKVVTIDGRGGARHTTSVTLGELKGN